MQALLLLMLVVCLGFIFLLVMVSLKASREYREEVVRNYKHGEPYRFAVWANFKTIVVDGIRAAWRGDSPRTVSLVTIPYPDWVVERAKKEGPCHCYMCESVQIIQNYKKT